MDIDRIQYCLKIVGSSFAAIGRECGVSRSNVRAVCASSGSTYSAVRSKKVEIAVAAKLGLELHELFPKWYDKQNVRIAQRSRLSIEQRMRAVRDVMALPSNPNSRDVLAVAA